MDLATESLSISWWDFILGKVVMETSETRYSLDQYDLAYVMNLYEMLTYKEYMESLRVHDQTLKVEKERVLSRISKIGK